MARFFTRTGFNSKRSDVFGGWLRFSEQRIRKNGKSTVGGYTHTHTHMTEDSSAMDSKVSSANKNIKSAKEKYSGITPLNSRRRSRCIWEKCLWKFVDGIDASQLKRRSEYERFTRHKTLYSSYRIFCGIVTDNLFFFLFQFSIFEASALRLVNFWKALDTNEKKTRRKTKTRNKWFQFVQCQIIGQTTKWTVFIDKTRYFFFCW